MCSQLRNEIEPPLEGEQGVENEQSGAPFKPSAGVQNNGYGVYDNPVQPIGMDELQHPIGRILLSCTATRAWPSYRYPRTPPITKQDQRQAQERQTSHKQADTRAGEKVQKTAQGKRTASEEAAGRKGRRQLAGKRDDGQEGRQTEKDTRPRRAE